MAQLKREKKSVTLNVDTNAMTILGVKFEDKKEFRVVWNAISSNMIEGWNPTASEVEGLKNHAISMRGLKISE